MARSDQRSSRGSRYTRPTVRTPDIVDGSAYGVDVVSRLRSVRSGTRLGLSGGEPAPIPSGLAELEYVFDQSDLTGYAGVVGFMQFAYGLGLADWLADVPLKRRRDAVYRGGKLCEVLVAMFVAGLERVSHIDEVKDDPGLCAAVGFDRLPDQATLSRFFSDAGAQTEQFLRSVNRRVSRETVRFAERQKRLLVDVDTREIGVYGKQEGSVCSPRNGGRPLFTFEVATLRNGREMLDGGLLEGATHPAPLFAERFESLLEQLSGSSDEVVFCADAAWYADYVLGRIEAADGDEEIPYGCKYAVRAQMRGELKRLTVGLDESAWVRYDEESEVAEVTYAFKQARDADGKLRRKECVARRHVVTRRRLAVKSGDQGELLEVPRYEVRAIVTNLCWAPKRVLRCYNQRATVESILKEGALGFHMDSLPSAKFAGNAVYCQLLILAYNLTNLFRRLCAPKEGRRHYVGTLRRLMLAVPGRVERAEDRCLVRCQEVGPQVRWLEQTQAAISRWIGPVWGAPVAAATPG